MLRPAGCSVLLLFVATTVMAAPAAKPPAEKPSETASKPKPAAPPTPEPEYMGICYRVAPEDRSLQSLERQTYAVQSKVKGLGFGGSRTSFEVPGTASPVRFPAGEPMEFVIRASSKDVDVATMLKLVPLKAAAPGKKSKAGSAGTRQMTWVDQHGLFGDVTVDPTLGALPILAKTFGEASIQFKPEADLVAGEYAVLLPSSMTAFCFGVDAKPAP